MLMSFRYVGLVLLIILFSSLSIPAQEQPKILEWGDHANLRCRGVEASKANYAIELEDILIDGRSVLVGQPFVGDVRDLVFRVKNISDGPFGLIQITVVLPEVKRPPEIPFVGTSADSKAKPVAPGQETELRVPSGKLYDWVKDTVAAQGLQLPQIKTAAIDAVIVQTGGQGVSVCIKARDPRNEWRPRP